MSENDPIERALEVFVYAPLGVGLWLRDLAPSLLDTVVARGKAEIDRRQEQAQQRITTARSMGQVAIAFGVPELRKRADAHLARAEQQLGSVREQAEQFVEQLTGPRSNGGSSEPTAAPRRREGTRAAPAAPAKPAAPRGRADAAAASSAGSAPAPATTTSPRRDGGRLGCAEPGRARRSPVDVERATCRSPATTRCRRRRSSSGWRAWRPATSRPCASTRRRTATGAPSSARSTS